MDGHVHRARGRSVTRCRLSPVVAHAALVWALAAGASAEDSACPGWRAAFAAMPARMIVIETGTRKIAVSAKVADTPERQTAGFQCATPDEIQRSVILFDFGAEILTKFHMRNVPAPLEIAFVKADGHIFSIMRMEPSPAALYGPMGAFRYALEARPGFFESLGIKQGEARLRPPVK